MSEVRHPLARLLSQLEEHRSVVILASLCSILNKVWDLAPPVLIGMAIDVVSARENSFLADMGYEDVHLQLYILTGITVVIWVLESLFQYFYAVLWRNLAQTAHMSYVCLLTLIFKIWRCSGSLSNQPAD